MKITYYKSLFCPRCISTNRLVAQIRQEHPEIEIEEVEVLTNLTRALQDSVHMLPTLVAGTKRFHRAPRMEELLAAARSEN